MKIIVHSVIFVFTFVTVFIAPDAIVIAQVRGPGVGALAGTTNGSTSVSVTSGRTAPWAEVIVDNAADEIQAVAEIDASGLFSFSFNTSASNVGGLIIYAVDEAGVTVAVPIPGTSLNDFILPPTIIGDTDGLPDTSIGVTGFSYPGATIEMRMTSDDGYDETFTLTATAPSGRWNHRVDNLPPANYTAWASASYATHTSLDSQDLTFTIPEVTPAPLPIPGADTIIDIITTTRDTVSDVGETVVEIIKELPQTTKESADLTSKILTPVAATSLLWTTGLLNLFNFINYITAGIRLILGVFVPKGRKRNRWGVVYDSVTKQPIARAIVRLYKAGGELVETEATGKNGIFSFLAEEGQYELKVAHPEYTFPSKIVIGVEDGEYQSVYRGDAVTVSRESPVVNVSVPMDPKGYSVVPAYNAFRDRLRKIGYWANAVLYVAGLTFSVVAYIVSPVFYNFFILLFYAVSLLFLVRRIYDDRTKWGIVLDNRGTPAPGVALSLLDGIFRRLVQRRVADRYGRYQFVAPKGDYFILVSSPEWELSPVPKSYGGAMLNIKKDIGVIKPKVVVAKKGSWGFGGGGREPS